MYSKRFNYMSSKNVGRQKEIFFKKNSKKMHFFTKKTSLFYLKIAYHHRVSKRTSSVDYTCAHSKVFPYDKKEPALQQTLFTIIQLSLLI